MTRSPAKSMLATVKADNKQFISWAGFGLEVPREWNLTLAHGDGDGGTVAFADLQTELLEVRWQSGRPKGLARRMSSLVKKMRRLQARVVPVAGSDGAWAIEHENRSIILWHCARRLYEISGPVSVLGPASDAGILNFFTDAASAELYRWRVYGIDASVPANWRLKRISLLPGGSRLEFQRWSTRLRTGSWSMADRLLCNRSLQQWALEALPLVQENPNGCWRPRGAGWIFEVPARARLLAKVEYLGLWRNHQNNCIVWWHTLMPSRNVRLARCLLDAFFAVMPSGAVADTGNLSERVRW